MAEIMGLILAGGRSRRFGSTKSDATLHDVPLAAWVRGRLAPQVRDILVSLNGPAPSALKDLPTVMDEKNGFQGPLAGLLAGLDWIAENRPEISRCVSVAVDAPFVPSDLVGVLLRAAGEGRAAVAASAGRPHPVIGLWPVSVANRLRAYLSGARRDVMGFVRELDALTVDFPASPFDPFFNINTPAELQEAERLCRTHGLMPGGQEGAWSSGSA